MSVDLIFVVGVKDGVCVVWDWLGIVSLLLEWWCELMENGFIQQDLWFYCGDDWMFLVVLNQGWVLWYVCCFVIWVGLVEVQDILLVFLIVCEDWGEVKLCFYDEDVVCVLWNWMMGVQFIVLLVLVVFFDESGKGIDIGLQEFVDVFVGDVVVIGKGIGFLVDIGFGLVYYDYVLVQYFGFQMVLGYCCVDYVG